MTKEHKVLKASHVEVQKINLIAAEVGKYVSPEEAYELATRLVLEPGLFEKLDGIRNAA